MAKKETKKAVAKKQQEDNNGLFSIYGCRKSKSGERLNVIILRGDENSKEWATISLKLDSKKAKVKAKIKDDIGYIAIPMLQDFDDEDDSDDEDDDALPF
jgi:C-terminal processing protease CtpA/Prc